VVGARLGRALALGSLRGFEGRPQLLPAAQAGAQLQAGAEAVVAVDVVDGALRGRAAEAASEGREKERSERERA